MLVRSAVEGLAGTARPRARAKRVKRPSKSAAGAIGVSDPEGRAVEIQVVRIRSLLSQTGVGEIEVFEMKCVRV